MDIKEKKIILTKVNAIRFPRVEKLNKKGPTETRVINIFAVNEKEKNKVTIVFDIHIQNNIELFEIDAEIFANITLEKPIEKKLTEKENKELAEFCREDVNKIIQQIANLMLLKAPDTIIKKFKEN